jgi:hypothetical protein
MSGTSETTTYSNGVRGRYSNIFLPLRVISGNTVCSPMRPYNHNSALVKSIFNRVPNFVTARLLRLRGDPYSACLECWLPISVAAHSKAWMCVRSLAAIASLKPAWGMHACLLWILCPVRQRFGVGLTTRPEKSYRMWCVCLIQCDLET